MPIRKGKKKSKALPKKTGAEKPKRSAKGAGIRKKAEAAGTRPQRVAAILAKLDET
jgi:hypothetical protein